MRDSERRAPAFPSDTAPAVTPPRSPSTPSAGPRVRIDRFVVQGSTRYRPEALAALLQDLAGKELTHAELQAAADRLSDHYRAHGWLARAYLPGQEIRDGTLTIAVIESRLGAIKVETQDPAPRLAPARAAAFIAQRQRPGDPLSLDALEAGTRVLDELPGVSAASVLQAGAREGETDAIVRLAATAFASGSVQADNHGVRSTGRARATGMLALNSPLRHGDQASAQVAASTGNRYGRLAYQTPAGSSGLRLGVQASALEYALRGSFAAAQVEGEGRIAGLTADLPLQRGPRHNLSLFAQSTWQRYDNRALERPLSNKRNRSQVLGVSGDWADGAGITLAGLALHHGRIDLSGNAEDLAVDQLTERVHGSYRKWTANLARLQRLGAADALWLSWSGQAAHRNLDSSEKIGLGGPAGVRAYPALEASGDEGWIATVEWRRRLADAWQLALFYDHGRTRQHKEPWPDWNAVQPSLPNRYALRGAGIGLQWSLREATLIQLELATRLGDNAGRHPATGADSEGSRRRTRPWLSLVHRF